MMSRLARLRYGAAGADDAGALAALHRTAFPRGWSAQELALLLDEPGSTARAAWRGDTLTGFALGRVAADEAEVLSLVVAETSRRRGTGEQLLSLLEDSCRDKGADAIFLEVSEKNVAAMTLYYRADYRQVGRRPRYYEDGAAALLLRKSL